LVPLKNLKIDILPDIIMQFKDNWEATRRLVRLPSSNLVEKLLIWGVEQREPIAIYMGEKVAMLTHQRIPHEVAKAVAQVLSIKKRDDSLSEKCKEALAIVGRIVRDDIYDFDKEYDHITEHTGYQSYLEFLSTSTFHPLEDNILTEQLASPVRWSGKFGPSRNHQL